ALYLRQDAPALLRPLGDDRPNEAEHDRIRSVLAERGACFFRELAVDDHTSLEALWDLVWAGEVTNDTFAPVRAQGARGSSRRRPAPSSRGNRARPRLGSLTVLGPPRAQGRWSLVDRDRGDATPTETVHALAGSLLERHGILTREAVRGEAV